MKIMISRSDALRISVLRDGKTNAHFREGLKVNLLEQVLHFEDEEDALRIAQEIMVCLGWGYKRPLVSLSTIAETKAFAKMVSE